MPDPQGKDYVANSKDYCLVMHFYEGIKDRLRGLHITEDAVD